MILNNISSNNTKEEVVNKVNLLIDKLFINLNLEDDEFLYLLENISQTEVPYLFKKACKRKEEHYDIGVFMRGLIEFTNYCNKGCLYCGISRHNSKVDRYRLTKDQIVECAKEGKRLGYKTFVLQGGEDPYYDIDMLVDIVKSIKEVAKECAVTLSFGELTKGELIKLKEAGVDRYLLRHETASKELYQSLHSSDMSFENRIDCLWNLKELGFQVGCGFMVNTPNQTNKDLLKDIRFIQELKPEMCGIGPYLSHKDTPLSNSPSGTLDQTLIMVAITRLVLPKCLLPSTTALGTLDNRGREKALKAGANVVMPNLSPTVHREKYEIYENKICTGDEAAHCRGCIETRILTTGYEVDMGVGHHKNFE